MLSKEFQAIKEEMLGLRKITGIISEHYNDIKELRKEGFRLNDILEHLKKRNMLPPDITYKKFVDMLSYESRRRKGQQSKVINDTQKKKFAVESTVTQTEESKAISTTLQKEEAKEPSQASSQEVQKIPQRKENETEEERAARRAAEKEETRKRVERAAEKIRKEEEAAGIVQKVKVDPKTGEFEIKKREGN